MKNIQACPLTSLESKYDCRYFLMFVLFGRVALEPIPQHHNKICQSVEMTA